MSSKKITNFKNTFLLNNYLEIKKYLGPHGSCIFYELTEAIKYNNYLTIIILSATLIDVIKNEKNIYFLEKKFTFKNFVESQKFVNEVGRISEEEGHHPEILFGWGYAKINISTHAIEGLSENDFILASKIDKI